MEIAKVMKVFTRVEYFFESSDIYVQADWSVYSNVYSVMDKTRDSAPPRYH